jgi:hypothetical protein
MGISCKSESRASSDSTEMAVECSDDELRVSLADGRRLSVPIVWFPQLAHATPAERANLKLTGEGQGMHWPDVDEDRSVVGLVAGRALVEFKVAFA